MQIVGYIDTNKDYLHGQKMKFKIEIINNFVFGAASQLVLAALLLRAADHTQLDTLDRMNSSKRVIGCSQKPLPTQYTANQGEEYSCPERDSKPRFQQ